MTGLDHFDVRTRALIDTLTRERDEARAEVERLRGLVPHHTDCAAWEPGWGQASCPDKCTCGRAKMVGGE